MLSKETGQKWRGFLYGGMTGAIVFLLLYGVSTLNPTYDSWIFCGYVEQDIIQSYAAWQYARNASWDIPLCWLDNVAKPLGASAAYADPLPWALLLFKALNRFLPPVFQYFGLVNFLNYSLQGAFAWGLIQLFDQRGRICLPGTLLFCAWPVLIERTFRHTALASQWLVLWMLYLYFVGRRKKTLPWLSWLLLFVLIPGVHAYFLPMAFGLLCAAALEYVVQGKGFGKRLGKAAGFLAICVAAALVCARGLGVIMPNASMGGWGYGYYSMNLNALFNPSSMDLYTESGTLDWSLFLPQLEQGKGQYDGFNYLGFGALIGLAALAVYGVVCLKRPGAIQRFKAFLVSHIGLLIACCVFVLFSVSHVIYWGAEVLAELPLHSVLKEQVFAAFRASGRIFWPVSYLIALSLVVAASRIFKKEWGAVALTILLAVQLVDMAEVLTYKGEYFRQGALVSASDFESGEAMELLSSADEIYCLNDAFSYQLSAYVVRYNPEVQTDLQFFSKGNYQETYARYEESKHRLISGQPIEKTALYITSDENIWHQVSATMHPQIVCWQIDEFYIFGLQTQQRPPAT